MNLEPASAKASAGHHSFNEGGSGTQEKGGLFSTAGQPCEGNETSAGVQPTGKAVPAAPPLVGRSTISLNPISSRSWVGNHFGNHSVII